MTNASREQYSCLWTFRLKIFRPTLVVGEDIYVSTTQNKETVLALLRALAFFLAPGLCERQASK